MSAKLLARKIRQAIAKKQAETLASEHYVVILTPNTTIEASDPNYNPANLYIETVE